MPAQLLSLNEGPNILLDKPILLLGRHPECDVQVDSRKISRRHCCIAQVSDYLVVRDLGSTNGVRINGVRVLEGRLEPGDELTIGTFRYKVVWDSLVKPSMPAAMAQPVGKPVLTAPVDDDDEILESCDEPVPLPEPRRSSPDIPFPIKPPPPGATPVSRPQAPPAEESLILPEHLDLLPNSDIYSGKSNHSSRSHPPHQSPSS